MRGLFTDGRAKRRMLPVVIAAAVVLVIAGCSSSPAPSPKSATEQPPAAMQADTTGVQMCADCNGKGTPPKATGAAKVENGVQVIEIGVKNGYYAPNSITAKAGMPTKAVFAGSAKGCLAKPTFSSLAKKADFTSGTATLDLGTLQPGTYTFTCGMGKNAGTVTVQ